MPVAFIHWGLTTKVGWENSFIFGYYIREIWYNLTIGITIHIFLGISLIKRGEDLAC
jgi:hypothetical protein